MNSRQSASLLLSVVTTLFTLYPLKCHAQGLSLNSSSDRTFTQATSRPSILQRFKILEPDPQRPRQGKTKVAVVVADITLENEDGSTRFFPAPLRDPAAIKEYIFGERGSVDAGLREASWGHVSLDGDISGDGEVDILGPVSLTFKTNQRADTRGEAPFFIGGDQITEGELCSQIPNTYNSFPDLIGMAHFTITLSDPGAIVYSNCEFNAASDVPDAAILAKSLTPTDSENERTANRFALVHEIGHILGLEHSAGVGIDYNGTNKAARGFAQEYGDSSCLMGIASATGSTTINPPQAYRLGWVPKNSIREISKAGSYTLTLANPAKGPHPTLPTSIWIEREAKANAPAPGYVIISAGSGGPLATRVHFSDHPSTMLKLTGIDTIPFGITVHTAPLDYDIESGESSFLGRPLRARSYLEGFAGLGESFTTPLLGVTVTLLARNGDESVVRVDVADMHTLFTDKIEEKAPGTLADLRALTRVRRGQGTTPITLATIRKLTRLVHSTRTVIGSKNNLSPHHYFAGEDVKSAVYQLQSAARKVLRAGEGQRGELIHTTLKPLAVRYVRMAAGLDVSSGARPK